MGHRLSAAQWGFFKKEYASSIEDMKCVIITFDTSIFQYKWRIITGQKYYKQQQSDALKEILKWCDETLDGQYYAETWYSEQTDKKGRKYQAISGVKFYLINDEDAVLLKLSWWE